MKAFLKNYRQSPRKVRLIADLVRGKDIKEAEVVLDNLVKRAGLPVKKLLLSAKASAKESGSNVENLFVKSITVDKGFTMKRMRARAMGRGARINKRTSNISVELAEKKAEKKTVKQEKKVTKVTKKESLKEDKKKVKKEKTVKKKLTAKSSAPKA